MLITLADDAMVVALADDIAELVALTDDMAEAEAEAGAAGATMAFPVPGRTTGAGCWLKGMARSHVPLTKISPSLVAMRPVGILSRGS